MREPMAVPRSTFSMRTGVAHLRSLPADTLLDLALQRAERDVFVSPILHEVIHHACANTAVNVALQYRWLELLRLLLSSPGFGYGIDEELVSMAADLAAGEAALQPIAEGLALFAEFDCAVPGSPTVQSVMLGPADALLWRLLALKGGVGSHVDALRGALLDERLDARTVVRKADLLCNPVRPGTGNDTYLIGYLVVKALWTRFLAGGPDPRLRAPSFLHFVMYYLYEDWTLAGLVLSADRLSGAAVARRVADRLASLFSMDLARQVAAFTDDLAGRHRERGTLIRGPEEREHGGFSGLDLSADEIRAGMRALVRFDLERVGPGARLADQTERVAGIRNLQHASLMAEMDPQSELVADLLLRGHVPGRPIVRLLDFIVDLPKEKRPYCYLLDVPVGIGGEAEELMLWASQDRPMRSLRVGATVADPFASRPAVGRLVGVVTSTDVPWRFYAFLLQDASIVCSWAHGGEVRDASELQRLGAMVQREAQIERATELSLPMLNEYLVRNVQVSDAVARQADSATSDMVARLRGLLAAEGWGGLLSSGGTRDFGFLNVVPRTADVRCLAAAGLCGAFGQDRAGMEERMARAGYRLEEALAVSQRASDAAGPPLIRMDGEQVSVAV